MKRSFVAALIGGIILFVWQFVSWNAVNFHEASQRYTPQQETIMTTLSGLQLAEGGYFMPMAPPDASMEEWTRLMDASVGKPWAKVEYHRALENNMVLNMITGLVINFITVWLLCWIISRFAVTTFANVLLSSLFTGLIVFFNAHYTHFIWYDGFDIWAHFADAVISWGLCGVWLGWWLNREVNEKTSPTQFSAATTGV